LWQQVSWACPDTFYTLRQLAVDEREGALKPAVSMPYKDSRLRYSFKMLLGVLTTPLVLLGYQFAFPGSLNIWAPILLPLIYWLPQGLGNYRDLFKISNFILAIFALVTGIHIAKHGVPEAHAFDAFVFIYLYHIFLPAFSRIVETESSKKDTIQIDVTEEADSGQTIAVPLTQTRRQIEILMTQV